MDEGTVVDRRGDIALFCLVACGVSWVFWFAVIASARGWLPVRVGPGPWGSFGPAIAALVVCGFRGGRGRVVALLRSLVAWRFGLRQWLLALLGPPALMAAAAGLYAATGGSFEALRDVGVPELLGLAVLVLVFGGPLGEEVGWRGYLLPALLRRMGPVAASLVVAVVWLVWHLPLFWMPGAVQQGDSILIFAAFVTAFSLLATWLYLAAAGSLLVAIVWHFSVNMSTYAGPMVQPTLDSREFYSVFLGVMACAGLAAAWALARRGAAHT